MKSFTGRFNFDPEKHLFLGAEREFFLTRDGKNILPIAPEIISRLDGRGNFSNTYGYELSACQLEMRTEPSPIENFYKVLKDSNESLKKIEKSLGFKALHKEVAPFDMPLDVYPDPSGRYQEITKNMPIEKLRAACRVIGTHVHIGMGSRAQAIKVYNKVIEYVPLLCDLGDGSGGERLKIYKIMAPDFEPPHYDSWEDYKRYAVEHNFDKSPRSCYHLIRISIHGTIEFRMFGTTSCTEKIYGWAKFCHHICRDALR